MLVATIDRPTYQPGRPTSWRPLADHDRPGGHIDLALLAALVADITRPEQRGVVYGLMAAAGSLGGFFGPLIGSGLAATLGFSATFLATGLILLLLAAGIALGGPRVRMAGEANLASGAGNGP